MATGFSAVELPAAHSSTPAALNAYLDYQTARSIRRTLTGRVLLFVLGVAILSLGLRLLPVAALVVTVLLGSGMWAVAAANELKARRRLRQVLKQP